MSWLSGDGQWQISTIAIDTTGYCSRQVLRVESRQLAGLPLHTSRDGPGLRTGSMLGPGGWYQGPDVQTPAEMKRLLQEVPMPADARALIRDTRRRRLKQASDRARRLRQKGTS